MKIMKQVITCNPSLESPVIFSRRKETQEWGRWVFFCRQCFVKAYHLAQKDKSETDLTWNIWHESTLCTYEVSLATREQQLPPHSFIRTFNNYFLGKVSSSNSKIHILQWVDFFSFSSSVNHIIEIIDYTKIKMWIFPFISSHQQTRAISSPS
jgi:hypothetical protein